MRCWQAPTLDRKPRSADPFDPEPALAHVTTRGAKGEVVKLRDPFLICVGRDDVTVYVYPFPRVVSIDVRVSYKRLGSRKSGSDCS